MNRIKLLINSLKHNEFWSSVAKLSAGQIIAQAITLAATLVLSRVYSNADYGTYGIIVSTSALIMSFVSLALGSAIMVAKTDEDSKRVFTVAYFLQMILVVLVITGMLALMPVVKFFNITISYPLAILLIGLYIALNTLNTMLRIYVNRKKLNNVLFINSLITAGCNVCVAIPLGFLKFGFMGLFLTTIVVEILSAIQMLFKANPFIRIKGLVDIKQTFIDCKKFLFFQYPSNLMGSFSQNIPQQTLYYNYSDEALGSYAMCNKLFRMPLNLLITPIQTVYFRTAAHMADEKEKLSDFSFGFIKKFMYIALIPMIVLMSFGEYIFGFVLGAQWKEAGTIAAIMCLYYFFNFCYGSMTYLRVSINKQKINLIMTFIHLTTILIALGISMGFHLDLLGTIFTFTIIDTLYFCVDLGINFVCMKKNAIKYFMYSGVFSAICIISVLTIRYILNMVIA